MDRQPNIAELIGFIQNNKPEKLIELKKENPTYTSILEEGYICGEEEEFNKEEFELRAKVCLTALGIALESCNSLLPKLKAKMKNSQRLQLYGQLLTTISSASLITLLQTKYKEFSYIPGILSLLGALVPLVVDFTNKSVGSDKNIFNIYEHLVGLKLQSEKNINELSFYIKNKFNIKNIAEIINISNDLCTEIQKSILLV